MNRTRGRRTREAGGRSAVFVGRGSSLRCGHPLQGTLPSLSRTSSRSRLARRARPSPAIGALPSPAILLFGGGLLPESNVAFHGGEPASRGRVRRGRSERCITRGSWQWRSGLAAQFTSGTRPSWRRRRATAFTATVTKRCGRSPRNRQTRTKLIIFASNNGTCLSRGSRGGRRPWGTRGAATAAARGSATARIAAASGGQTTLILTFYLLDSTQCGAR